MSDNLSNQSERDILIQVCTTVTNMSNELLGGGGRVGRIPSIETSMAEHSKSDSNSFNSIDKQLSYWKGAIAICAFLLLVFGALFIEHVLASGGK